MKMMKKIASLVLAGAMTLSMSVAAFALTGVSTEEQKILDAAPAKQQSLVYQQTVLSIRNIIHRL